MPGHRQRAARPRGRSCFRGRLADPPRRHAGACNLQIIARQQDEFAARSRGCRRNATSSASSLSGSLCRPHAGSRGPGPVRRRGAPVQHPRLRPRGLARAVARRIVQLRAEIIGYGEQRDAKLKEHELIQRDLVGVRNLYRQNLVQISRLSQLEREAAALEGARGQLTAQIAQAEGKISEIELQILQVTEDLRAEAMKELREIQARGASSSSARSRPRTSSSAWTSARRSRLGAPDADPHGRRGDQRSGAAMLIVPTGEAIQLEARVSTQDYDQVSWVRRVVRLHASTSAPRRADRGG